MKTHTWFAHVLKSMVACALIALVMGIAFSAPPNAYADSPGGNALNFDGTDDYILTGINPATMLNQTFTLEAWVYPRSQGNYRAIGGQQTETNKIVFGQYDSGAGGWDFSVTSPGGATWYRAVAPSLPLNVWTHVAAVYVGGTSGSITVYLNGVQSAQTTFNSTIAVPSSFEIGRTYPDLNNRYYDGQIDEFRAWSTARTTAEIRQNMFRELGATAHLQAVYHLNESSGTTASDSSGNGAGRDGTLNNFPTTPWRTSGAFAGPRNALDFNGTTDYVNIADNNTLDMTSNYTLEAWVYPRTFKLLGGIISKYHSLSANGYFLRLSGSGNNRGISFDEMVTADNLLTANTWYHIAAVNSGDTRTLYINGVQVPLTGTPITVQANTDPVEIGVDYNFETQGRFFDGAIDEARIWNIARTAAQIRDDMAHQLVGNESGLVAYYRFDEGTASGTNTGLTTLDDLTSNGYNGTLNNFALTGATSNWVASSAFNTWIGAEGTGWATDGNWSRNAAPVATDNVGVYTYGAPTNAPALAGASTVNNLVVTSPLAANADLTVNGNLLLDADVTASGTNAVILGASTAVTGTNDIVGIARRTSPATGTAFQFNNQFTTFNFANALSAMDVKLIKTAPSGLTKAVTRYYTLTTGTGTVNAAIQLAYKPSEVNGTTEANNALWRWNGSRWVLQGGITNTVDANWHYVTLTGVTTFSDWAITNDGAPTAVTLSSFQANTPTFDLGAWLRKVFGQ